MTKDKAPAIDYDDDANAFRKFKWDVPVSIESALSFAITFSCMDRLSFNRVWHLIAGKQTFTKYRL